MLMLLLLLKHVWLMKQCQHQFYKTSDNIVSKLVKIYLSKTEQSEEDITDMVFNYSIDFLTLSLLWYGYHDSVKEGDGDTIL